MITYYTLSGDQLESHVMTQTQNKLPAGALWVDLMQPTEEEEDRLEAWLALDIPTREEMKEIEDSSRFYEENGVLFMTVPLVSGLGEGKPQTTEVTFILTEQMIITVRYAELRSFRDFASKCGRQSPPVRNSGELFTYLMDSMVDRIADVLEEVQRRLTDMSHTIFNEDSNNESGAIDLQQIVKRLGRNSSLLFKLSDSLLGLNRMNSYFVNSDHALPGTVRNASKTIVRDIRSLNEYHLKMTTEIDFLLDATLGLINIEQNGIIKVFSIAAVLFLPPTLVGTVYGMNFKIMPELDWSFGYPLALVGMVISAILPFLWFKYKGWL